MQGQIRNNARFKQHPDASPMSKGSRTQLIFQEQSPGVQLVRRAPRHSSKAPQENFYLYVVREAVLGGPGLRAGMKDHTGDQKIPLLIGCTEKA